MTDGVSSSIWARLPIVGNLGYPIALKEVRALIRRNRYFWVQFLYLIVLAAGVLITIVAAMGDSQDYQQVSGQVANLFFVIQLFLVLLIFPAFASTAISSERVEKSFDLLTTTDLTPTEIVWGKFLGIFGNCCYFLLVTLPILGICILFGGAPIFEAGMYYGILVILAAMLTIYGLMVSAWARSNIRAVLITYAPVILITFVLSRNMGFWTLGGLPDLHLLFLDPVTVLNIGSVLFLVFVFCFVASVQLLTSEEGNRATPMRVLVLIGLVLLLVLGFLNIPVPLANQAVVKASTMDSYFENLSWFGFVILTPLLLCLSGGRVETPLRVVQQTQRRPAWMYTNWLLLPGGVRGLVYSGLVSLVLVLGLVELLQVDSVEQALFKKSSDVAGLNQYDSFILSWSLIAIGVVTYCSLAFLVSALGVRGALNLVIVTGFIVLANLYAAVLEQNAETPDDVFLRPLSVLVTLSRPNSFEVFDEAVFRERVHLAMIVHLSVAALLTLVGCVIMKVNKAALLGMTHDRRLETFAAPSVADTADESPSETVDGDDGDDGDDDAHDDTTAT